MPLGRFTLAFLPLALTHCFPPGDGVEPPAEEIYFPVGLAIDYQSGSLFVANSDFDLQYNQGVLQRYDLERLREVIPRSCKTDADCTDDERCDVQASEENGGSASYFCVDRGGPDAGRPCGAFPDTTAVQRVTAPGRCGAIDPSRPQDGGPAIITSTVQIGAFATDVIFRQRPSDADPGAPGRLFLPVRGDTTLHVIDVEADGSMECGQDAADGRCDDEHRVGDDPDAENTRDIRMPVDPFGVAASADGRVLVVTHQTQGQVSLFVNEWNSLPRLEFIAGGLPSRPMEVAALPIPELVPAAQLNYQPGFLVSFRNSAEVRLLRFFDDGLFSDVASTPARPYLAEIGRAGINTNSVGTDSRGLAIDGSRRQQQEQACEFEGQAQLDCLRAASATPLGVYVANRTPPSLVIGQTRVDNSATSSSDIPFFHRALPLTAGPSRVFVGSIINEAGALETRIFVVCFDSRLIFIYDPASDRIEAEVFTGRGPHPVAFDVARGVGYIGHFTDSYLGVVALDQRFPRTFGTIIATIGTPTPPRATK